MYLLFYFHFGTIVPLPLWIWWQITGNVLIHGQIYFVLLDAHKEKKNRSTDGWLKPKSDNKTSLWEISLNIKTHTSPKVGQDQVSWEVSALLFAYTIVTNAPLRFQKYRKPYWNVSLHIVWWDPNINHKTFLETIQNVNWHILARESYWKVALLFGKKYS